MSTSIPLSVSVVLLSIIAAGIYDILTNFEKNGCEMTYMYEYPNYKKISLGASGKNHPAYGLFIYGEGTYAEEIKDLNLKGIPVLFIPGNAGSHKQVRSLGSVALRISEHPQVKSHFNYFVVDFNEEMSALYGGLLYKQTNFVNICIKKILSLYKRANHPPSSVVLVGHSMGGIIARALFTLPDFNSALVTTIITQATPHQRPVAPVDGYLEEFYSKVNGYWKDHAEDLRHVTVVSTGGGYRDMQVRYGLTVLDGIVASDRAISVSTMAIPKAWVSTDHLCSVWCRQMVLLTKRALFDIVDKKTRQISTDSDLRMKVFTHHFINNNGLSDYLTYDENKTISLDSKALWTIRKDKIWRHTDAVNTKLQYIAMPLVVEERTDTVIVITNLTNPEWICYCDIPKGQDKCSSCTSLASRTKFLPPLYSNTKYVRIAFKTMNMTPRTHIVVIVPARHKKVGIIADRYNSDERHLVFQMPNTYDTIISYPVSATDGAAMLRISNGSAFYSLHLAGLSLPTNTYRALVMPMGCRRHSAESNEGNLLRLNIPWSKEDTFAFSGYGKEVSIPVKIQTGRPQDYDWHLDASEPHLEMYLHPYCHYKLKLIVATQDTMGQFMRFYAAFLPSYLVAVLMLTLRGTIAAHSKNQFLNIKEQSPADSVFEFAKPYYIIPFVLVFNFLVRFGPISKLLLKIGVPEDDAVSLIAENIWFRFLPVVLYVICWGLVYLQAFVVFTVLSIISHIVRFMPLPDKLLSILSYLHIVSTIFAILSCFMCSSLGVIVSTVLLTLRVCYLLSVVSNQQDTRNTHRKLSLYFPIMLLVNLQAVLSIAPLVVWLKSLNGLNGWIHTLDSDPNRLSSLLISLGVAVLLYSESPLISKKMCSWICLITFSAAAMTLMYATRSIYRLPMFTGITVVLIALASLLERRMPSAEKDD